MRDCIGNRSSVSVQRDLYLKELLARHYILPLENVLEKLPGVDAATIVARLQARGHKGD